MKKIWVPALFLMLGLSSNAYSMPYTFTSIDFPGATDTFSNGINDNGSIVGSYNKNGLHGFLYKNGKFTTIDFPNPPERFVPTKLNDINNSGEIIGTYNIGRIGTGFSFKGKKFSTINPPEATGDFGTNLNGISNRGLMVGSYDTGEQNVNFIWNGKNILSTFSIQEGFGRDSSANDINNRGLVTGTYFINADTEERGYIYDGKMITTLLFPGANGTTAQGINDHNQVVGGFDLHGFLFDGKYWQIDFPGSTSTGVNGINNLGQIVGTYSDGSHWHGFLASKAARRVSEPASMTLFGLALGGLFFARATFKKIRI